MGVVSVTSGSQAATISSEHSLAKVDGVGIYVLEVDTSAMQAGDTLEVRVKTSCKPGESLKVAELATMSGVQANSNWHSVPIPVASGDEIAATITQTAGTGRTYVWNLMRM